MIINGFGMWDGLDGISQTRRKLAILTTTLNVVVPVTNPPAFTATVESPVIGDTVRLQISATSIFTVITSEFTNVIDAAEISSGVIAFLATILISGTYYARARDERALTIDAWSPSVTFTV